MTTPNFVVAAPADTAGGHYDMASVLGRNTDGTFAIVASCNSREAAIMVAASLNITNPTDETPVLAESEISELAGMVAGGVSYPHLCPEHDSGRASEHVCSRCEHPAGSTLAKQALSGVSVFEAEVPLATITAADLSNWAEALDIPLSEPADEYGDESGDEYDD